MTIFDFYTLLPHTVLLVSASLLLLVDLWIPKERKGITGILAVIGLLAALVLTAAQTGQSRLGYQGMAIVDPFSIYLNILFAGSGIGAVALGYDYFKRTNNPRGEFYPLMMFSVAGMMLMASAEDLIMVFLALELLSIPLYILSGFAVPKPESEEAGLKYFLLGAFASGFVLYGIALTFGATGQTSLLEIVKVASMPTTDRVLFLAGSGLLLVGFGFKIAAAPFHMWTPDVYHGAPSPVAGFMSVGAKAAGFAALVRVFTLAFPSVLTDLAPVVAVLAGLTMIIGNFAALTQTNIKRMLAYSSIAHAGYLLMAFVPAVSGASIPGSVASIQFYLLVYGITSLGAWAVVTALESASGEGLEIDQYAGLWKRSPLMALSMSIFMLSFTGVPPLLGFWGKFYLFRTTIEGGNIALAVIGLLTSLVSAWYYLRVIVKMTMQSGETAVSGDVWIRALAGTAAAALLLIGFFPGALYQWAMNAVLSVF